MNTQATIADTQAAFVQNANDSTLMFTPYASVEHHWLSILVKNPAASLYHQPAWLEVLSRSYGLALYAAVLYRNDEVASICILARSKNPFVHHFVSLPFSDSCGPLPGGDIDERLLISLLPAVGPAGASYELRGVASTPPWVIFDRYREWTIYLERPLNLLARALDSNFKRNLRQAKTRGIALDRGSTLDLLRRFYCMQLLTRQRLGLPPQPWSFFRTVHEVFAPRNQMEIWIASVNRTDEAGAVFIRSGDTIYFKWGARRAEGPSAVPGANHLLMWSAVESFAGQARRLDLGRTDVRNEGLNRFKHGLGGTAQELIYSFYPRLRSDPSSEALAGKRAMLARVWRHLPLAVTQMLSQPIYRYLG